MPQLDPMQRQALEARIVGLAEQVAARMGMEVVLAEVKGGGRAVIRVFIDQPGGISLEDCERYSRRLSVALDVEDWIPFSYVLEVSSPGLDRPLRKEGDFQRFAGKSARIRTRVPFDGQKNFKGKIVSVDAGRLKLELEAERRIEIALEDIEKANLVAEL
jgi:ribosome maturation factor RimP